MKILQVALQQGFAGKMRNCFAACVAQTHELLPIRGLRISGGLRINWRRKSDRHIAGARKIGAIAEKIARPRKRNGNKRSAGVYRCFECAELEWTDAVFGNESTFGKNENGIAGAKNIFDLLRCLPARARPGAIERKMAHFFQEGADERHVEHFFFCDESVRNAEAEHERKNVKVAAMIGHKYFWAGEFHVLF